MRDAYREQLDAVTARLVGMLGTAGSQMRLATRALLDADLRMAEEVVSGDAPINRAQREVDEEVIEVMATQGPVAGELREVTTALRVTADIERMGDLAVHVAKIARMRFPDHAVPEGMREIFTDMSATASEMAEKAGDVLRTRDAAVAAELALDDNAMDQLHRSLFSHLLDDNWDRGVESAVDIALLGRYYERFADHAVEIAGHVRYLVTGETP